VRVLVAGNDVLARRNTLRTVRDMRHDLQSSRGDAGLGRGCCLPPVRFAGTGKLPAAIVPADLPEGGPSEYDKFVEKPSNTNRDHSRSSFVRDGTLALIVL